jgi:hypothetical protein
MNSNIGRNFITWKEIPKESTQGGEGGYFWSLGNGSGIWHRLPLGVTSLIEQFDSTFCVTVDKKYKFNDNCCKYLLERNTTW